MQQHVGSALWRVQELGAQLGGGGHLSGEGWEEGVGGGRHGMGPLASCFPPPLTPNPTSLLPPPHHQTPVPMRYVLILVKPLLPSCPPPNPLPLGLTLILSSPLLPP